MWLIWLLFVLTVVWTSLFFAWIHLLRVEAVGKDALLILGYKTSGASMHPLLEERLHTAICLIHRYPYAKVIVSGGAVGGSKPEAESMKEFLVCHGVDPSRILVENESKDTIENLEYTLRIMKREQLQNCLIVSNSFHLRRVRMIADAIDLNSLCYAHRSWRTPLQQVGPTINEIRAFVITLKLLKQRKGI